MSKISSPHQKRSHKKRTFIVVAIVICLLAGAGAAGYYFWPQLTGNKDDQSSMSQEVKEQVVAAQAKYDEALKSATPEEKLTLYTEKVYVYESAGDYGAAVTSALEVVKLDEANPAAYANVARLAALAQDDAVAREYYSKALDVNTRLADGDTKQLQKQYYEQELAKLGAAK